MNVKTKRSNVYIMLLWVFIPLISRLEMQTVLGLLNFMMWKKKGKITNTMSLIHSN